MRYAPQLDGLRALCIAFTIFNHVGPHPVYLNGNVGVDVFFVLSGFLITSLLEHEKNSTGSVCLRCFYIRRIFRIVPLYLLTIILYAISTYALYRSGIDPLRWTEFRIAAPALLTFMGEYRPDSAGTLFGHAWTLGIEEKYYVLWPLVLLGLRRLGRFTTYATITGMILVSWMFLPANHEARGYGGLLAGSMAAILNTDGNRFLAKRVFSLPDYVYLTAVLAGYLLVVMYDGARIHVVLTLAAAPFIAVLVRSPAALAQFLGSKAFAFVGRRTYGIYLIHLLVANGVITLLVRIHVATHWFLIFVLTLGLSLAIASVLKAIIEDPLIARGKRWAGRLNLATPNLPGAAHNLKA